jgi:hypothetical protein
MNTANPADVEMGSAWVAGILTWSIIASGVTVALKLLTWSI